MPSIPNLRQMFQREKLASRVEGVFHYDRHTRYQLTFDDALMSCKLDFGAEMANRDQLLLAYTSGLEECRAGWLISGEVAYPRVQRNWKCGENKTGIISYGIRKNHWEKWDVFCYKLDDDCSMYNGPYLNSLLSHLEGNLHNSSIPPHPVERQLMSSTSRAELSQTTIKQVISHGETLGTGPPQLNEHNSSSADHNLSISIFVTDLPPVAKHFNADNLRPTFPTDEKISHKELVTEIVQESMSLVNNDLSTSAGSESQISVLLPRNSTTVSKTALKDATVGLLGFMLPTRVARILAETVSSKIHWSGHNSSKPPLSKTTFSDGDLNIGSSSDSSNSHMTPLNPTAWTRGNRQKLVSVTPSDEGWEAISRRGNVQTFGAKNGDHSISIEVETKLAFLAQRAQRLDKPKKSSITASHTSQVTVYATQSQNLQPDKEITAIPFPFNPTKEDTSDFPNASSFIRGIGTRFGPITRQEIDLKATDRTSASTTSMRNVLKSQTTTYLEKYKPARVNDFNHEPARHLSPLPTVSDGYLQPTSKAGQEQGSSSGVLVTSSTIQKLKPTAYTGKPLASPVIKMEVTPSFQQLSSLHEPLDTCGGVLRGKAGQFQSPGFPLSYQSDMKCKWVIESPVGHRVVLDFLKLVLEEHRTCQYDYVLVYDGTDDKLQEIGRFCGSQLTPQLRSTSNVMTLVMRTDSSLELDGFFANFSSLKSTSESIRLVGGRNLLEGLVEIKHRGIWGGICLKHWEQEEAQVVCRQLGYAGSAIATRRISRNSDDRVSVSYVKCTGHESTLEHCNLTHSGRCGTQERAGLICQVLNSCAALKSAGVLESGVYTIDPDGLDHGEEPFPVECDMQSEQATGITIVGHNAEAQERVSPCENAGCYTRNITYKDASLDQLRALTAVSEYCEQFVKDMGRSKELSRVQVAHMESALTKPIKAEPVNAISAGATAKRRDKTKVVIPT
ncbi:uncharacterized protein [Pleurodeles waltl]|uniref:uncharacterized protein n=1 Tax=Pleurodeles waltl TaxID=8319 RepID=UPI003709B836